MGALIMGKNLYKGALIDSFRTDRRPNIYDKLSLQGDGYIANRQSEIVVGFFDDSQSMKNFLQRINGKKIDSLGELLTSTKDYIISILRLPFNLRKYWGKGNDYNGIVLDRGSMVLGDNAQFSDVILSKAYGNHYKSGVACIGRFTFNRHFGNFMDFAPYTKIQLYVPFMGFVDIPTDEIMGKTIGVYLSVDILTNSATAYVVDEDDEHMILSTNGQIGREIPLGYENGAEITRNSILASINLLSGIATIGLGVASGGVGGMVLGSKSIGLLSNSAQSFLNNVQHVTRGQTNNVSGVYCPTSPYVVITRPKPIPIDANFNRIKGKPLGEYRTLSTLRGFTIIDSIHLDGLFNTATENEKSEIERLLKSGVHF